MPLLLLLMKLGVLLFLVPANDCRLSDSAESNLLQVLGLGQPTESKLLKFLKQQQAINSLGSPLVSWPTYISPATTLSEQSNPSIYLKGQESSWYLQEPQLNKPPPVSSLNSNLLPKLEALTSKPQLSNFVVPLDEPFDYATAWKSAALSNTVPFSKTKLTLCEIKKKLLKGTPLLIHGLNNENYLIQVLSTNYDNPLSRQSSRTRPKKIKSRAKSATLSKLAQDYYGSQKRPESLNLKKRTRNPVRKLKIFNSPVQERKFKEKLKLKAKKTEAAKKVKINAEVLKPLKKSWKNHGRFSARKSKTVRCFNSRKEDSSTRTVCVTYPASWGEGANYTIPSGTPYPYYYPYYYYPAYYYYPYFYYGRR